MKVDLNTTSAVKAPVQPEQALRRVQHEQNGTAQKVPQQQPAPQPSTNPAVGSKIDVQV